MTAHGHPARAQDGFTLLEILVSVVIMAMVLTFAFEAYQGIEHSYQRVGQSPSRDRAARVVMDRIERELVGSILVQREDGSDPLLQPYFFFGATKEYAEAEGDSLRFVTRTPIRAPGDPPLAFEVITYGTVPSQAGPGLALLRQAEPLTNQLVRDVTWQSPDVVADNVALFLLRYEGDNQQPTEGWDSTGAAQLDQLPISIVMTVSLWEHDESGKDIQGPEFTRTIDLPVRPFKLTPDKNGQQATSCGEGMTVTQCIQQFQSAMDQASPSLASAIKDAAGQVTDTCWNPEQPSANLQRLKVLMGGLPGFDAGECK
jgi:prepilin-type N-terminal cleavage/methylation domain-containing protein